MDVIGVMDPVFNAPNHIFGIGEVTHFKYRVLVHTEVY